jgi:hypothetical protein
MSGEDAFIVFCISLILAALTPLITVLVINVALLDDTNRPQRLKVWASSIAAWWHAKMDRAANCIQDWLIEWDLENEIRLFKETPPPLPAIDSAAFAEAMMPEINELLDAITQRINEAPNGTSVSAQGPAVRKLLDAWTKRALEVGEQLRVDAALEEPATFDPLANSAASQDRPFPVAATENRPMLDSLHSNWVRKFRRMKAAEGELAAAADD